MILLIPDVLDAEAVSQLRAEIEKLAFVDGAVTASRNAKLVKNNLQADMTTPEYARLNQSLLPIIGRNPTLQLAGLTTRFSRLRFSRYRDSMAYGAHVDAPLLDEVRTDLAFTLFLAPPESYDGGELVIVEATGERAFKLPAGHMIVYPATTLHRVAPVTRGERWAAFGWAQSAVADVAQREALYELEVARRALIERHGPSHELDLLNKTRSNMMRMWAQL